MRARACVRALCVCVCVCVCVCMCEMASTKQSTTQPTAATHRWALTPPQGMLSTHRTLPLTHASIHPPNYASTSIFWDDRPSNPPPPNLLPSASPPFPLPLLFFFLLLLLLLLPMLASARGDAVRRLRLRLRLRRRVDLVRQLLLRCGGCC